MTARNHARLFAAWLMTTCLVATSGCSAYDTRYAYQPMPYETVVQLNDDPNAAPLRMLSTIIGLHRSAKVPDARAFVEAVILFDNTSAHTIAFDPASAALFTANVRQFASPDPVNQVRTTIGSGETARVTLLFPVPEDDQRDPIEFDSLNLRWAIEYEGRLYYQSATFERKAAPTCYHDVYYPGHPGPYDHYFYHRHFRR